MNLEFAGVIVEWRGPAPYVFVRLPEEVADEIADVAGAVSYGWGCVPVACRIGATDFTTALIPREGSYMLPIKVAVQHGEGVGVGSRVWGTIHVDV